MTKLEMKKFENVAKHITKLDRAVRTFIVYDYADPINYDGVDRKVNLHWSQVPDLLTYMARYKGLDLSPEQVAHYKSLLEKKLDDCIYNGSWGPDAASKMRVKLDDLHVELNNLHVEYVLANIE